MYIIHLITVSFKIKAVSKKPDPVPEPVREPARELVRILVHIYWFGNPRTSPD